MLHLLPPSYIKELRKEYIRRYAYIACYVLALLFIIAAAAFIPSFILINAHKQALLSDQASSRIEVSESSKARVEAFEASLKKGIAHRARIDSNKSVSTKNLATLLAVTREGISISQIVLGRMDDTGEVEVRGVAGTRSALTGFVGALERAGYAVGDIPASTFTMDRQLPFVLSITPTTP